MQSTTLDTVSHTPFPWHQPLQLGPLPPHQDSLPLQSTCRTKGPFGCGVTGGDLWVSWCGVPSKLPSELLDFTSDCFIFWGTNLFGRAAGKAVLGMDGYYMYVIIGFTFSGQRLCWMSASLRQHSLCAAWFSPRFHVIIGHPPESQDTLQHCGLENLFKDMISPILME